MTQLKKVNLRVYEGLEAREERKKPAEFIEYNHPETVLLLHTSGTSGNKKLVPYSMDMIIIGVGCIVSSWNLQSSDVCLNMMPLFHIGGIVRNIFSPILSGGAVITCSGFDPLLFWDVLYAGTMVDGSPMDRRRLLDDFPILQIG
jgi:acyl-CoA synthetase (AMP-forming)/AMP-acid ligase II